MPSRLAHSLAALLVLTVGAQACRLQAPARATEYKAVVVGPSPPEETARQTKIAMALTGGTPAPRFAPLPRILADFRDEAGKLHRVISAVVDGVVPAPGVQVILRSRYIDPENDCQFIPWTVKSLGQAT